MVSISKSPSSSSVNHLVELAQHSTSLQKGGKNADAQFSAISFVQMPPPPHASDVLESRANSPPTANNPGTNNVNGIGVMNNGHTDEQRGMRRDGSVSVMTSNPGTVGSG